MARPWCVRDMSLVEPLLLDKTPKTVQTIVTPEGPQAASIRIVRLAAGDGETRAGVCHARRRPSRGADGSPRWRSSTWSPSAGGSREKPATPPGAGRPCANRGSSRARRSPGWSCTGRTRKRPWARCGSPARPTGPISTMFIPVCWTPCSSCSGRSCPARERASTPTCRWPSSDCSALRIPQGPLWRWPR